MTAAARRTLLLVALVGGVLIGVGGAPAQADSACPQVEGWEGPYSVSESADEYGGNIRCWYSPFAGLGLGSTVEALIEGNWVGDAEASPGAVMTTSGCGRDVTGVGTRTLSSDGSWAAVRYSISGAGADAEAILLSELEHLQQGAVTLLPYIESMAQSCTAETSDTTTDTTPTSTSTAVAPTARTAGANRYETAVQISQELGTGGVVYVATGMNFPDALGGGPAAAAESGRILLVEPNAIPATTAAELSRVGPSRIVVLGGTAAVSDAVVSALRAYAGTVDRVAGVNRYATAAAVSAYAFPGTQSTVYIAPGRSFPDPIIAGAAAAIDGAPLLLVDGQSPLESEVIAELVRMQPTEIVLVGADSDLTGVSSALGAYGSVSRVNQGDVYSRSAALWNDVPAGVFEVVLATSSAFADALAGTPYAATPPQSYLMLSRPDCVPAVVRSQMERLDPEGVRLLGGTAALNAAIETQSTC